MKKFRKLFAVLAASALVGALSFTSMAASISIKNAEQNKQTYTAYKILDATKGKEAGVASYTMDVNSPLVAALKNENQTWFDYKLSADGSKYIVTLKTAGDDNTAKAIANYFKDKLSGVTPIQLDSENPKEDVADGYYLIKSSFGTNMILATSDIEITEKNEGPQDDKMVETGSLTFGESATYYITVVVPASINTSKPIKVHDELSHELRFNDDVKVHVAGTNEVDTGTSVNKLKTFSYHDLGTDTVVTKTGLGDGCAFHIDIDPAAYAGQTLVFKYSAELLETAAADTEFVNREFLDYSEYTTTNKDVPVMTYDFDLEKTFKDSTNEQTELKATFNLYTAEEYGKLTDNSSETTAEAMKFEKDSDNQNHYYVSSSGNEGIEAAKGNKVNVRGLGEGTYYLVETDTAKGYNVLDHAIEIKVTPKYKDGKVTHSEAENTEVMITNGTDENGDPKTTYNFVPVENAKGLLLPSTGGMGTTVFAIAGLLVMAGAAVTLIVKKRA